MNGTDAGSIVIADGVDGQVSISANGSGAIKLGAANNPVTVSNVYTLPTAVTTDNNYVLTAQTDGSTAWAASGGGGITFPIEADSGSSGAPSYSFSADTDTGIYLSGASNMGIAAGGNINPQGVSMCEPIGGSAPKYTGKNVINPLACIAAASMMLDVLGEEKYANKIESAVIKTAQKLDSLSAGKMGMGTSEVGDMVKDFILNDEE